MTRDDEPISIGDVIQQLGDRRSDAVVTLELLDTYHAQIEEQLGLLENPQAVIDYLAFFRAFVGRAVDESVRIAGELVSGANASHASALRRLAAESSAEQRRCLLFRNACINRPLPHEKMRPLLNDISIATRDQLTAFRDFIRAADRLDRLVPSPAPEPTPSRAFDRRALFTRLLKRDDDTQ